MRLGQKYYRRAVNMYLADQVVSRLESAWTRSVNRLADALAVTDSAGAGDRWVDIGGQLMTARRLEDLCGGRKRPYRQRRGAGAALDGIQQAYGEDQWIWVSQACRQVLSVDLSRATAAGLCEIAELLRHSQREFLELILVDATKEFDAQTRTGFGLDGDLSINEADFLAVRGPYDDHTFVRSIRQQIDQLDQRIDRFRERIAGAN